MITLPAPEQRVELVIADLAGRTLRTIPLRGAMPAHPAQRDGALIFELDGTDQQLRVDLRDGQVRRQLRRVPALPSSPPPGSTWSTSSLSMPYVHQLYDTPDSFNGSWACGPTSTLMAIQHFGRLAKWPITVSSPSSHRSDYGAYVARKYTAFGYTFDRVQKDASGRAAQGGYGHCTQGGAGWAWRMQDYAKKHKLKSDFTSTATFSKIASALSAGKVVVLSNRLTSAGHLITVKGTSGSKLVVNDPYGNRNLRSYPNTKGENVVYTWTRLQPKWMITVYGTVTAKYPELTIGVSGESIAGQKRDLCTAGKSSGIFDWRAGQKTAFHFDVKNTGTADADGVEIGLWAEKPYVGVVSWKIYTRKKGGTALSIDSSDGKQTVSRTSPPQTFTLKLGTIAPGETKRIELQAKAEKFSLGLADHPDLRAWVAKVAGYYAKSSFAAKPSKNVGGHQKQNGGDLRTYFQTDVLDVERCDGVDNDCDGEIDESCVNSDGSGPADGGAQQLQGGDGGLRVAPSLREQGKSLQGSCTVGGGDSSTPPSSWLLLALVLLAVQRSRR